MPVQLMKLRNVPADELDEIHALLAARDIVVYETSAGPFGISMPALWMHDESRLAEARALLDDYAEARKRRVQDEHSALKAAGRARTFGDIARENPLRFVVYLALVAATAWFSVVPFLQAGTLP